MEKRYMVIGLVVLLLAAALLAAACGGNESTTSTVVSTNQTTSTSASTTQTTSVPATDTTVASGPATGQPIKIGFSNSLTGSGAAPGVSVSKGAHLQVDYFNANGGINGRPIELIEIDDQSDPAMAQANVTKLIEEDKVFANIGPFAQFLQARDLPEEMQIPTVLPGPANLADLANTKEYTWSVMTSSSVLVQVEALEKIIAANEWKNVLSIADILDTHQQTLDELVKAAPGMGITFTKMADTFGFDATDFQPILNRIMEEYRTLKPDVVFLYVNPIAAPALYKGLRALGVTVPIQGSPAAAHPAIFSMGPEAVEGYLVLDAGGISNPASLPDSYTPKQTQLDFAQRYQAEYGEAPDYFSTVGATIVDVLVAAMKQAGGADDQRKVADALINLKNVVTPEGVVNFTPEDTNQGIKGNMVEFVVKNGKFELVQVVLE
jgi:branched-chain amino acid transport system substrate-binding protein